MTARCAYKSAHPDVVACWRNIEDNTWFADVTAWGLAHGFTGRLVTDGRHVAGFLVDRPSEIPENWKAVERSFGTYAAPRRRTKEQKALCAEMGKLGKEPSTEDFPGMPTTVSVHVGGSSYRRVRPCCSHAGILSTRTRPSTEPGGRGGVRTGSPLTTRFATLSRRVLSSPPRSTGLHPGTLPMNSTQRNPR